MAWSMMERASRMEPSPASASRARVASSAEMFSAVAMDELADDVFELDGVKAEVLAAGADGLGDVLGLGGGHHEDDVVGRLLEGLEEGVEGGVGDLVRLVEDVDLVLVAGGAVAAASRSSRISSMPRLVAASISMTSTEWPEGISVQDSQMLQGSGVGRTSDPMALRQLRADGEDAGDGGLADAAVAGEDVAVGDAVLGERVEQRAGDVVLADDVGEEGRAVFSGENLVRHLQG